jgi:hypothetical protein
MRLHFGLGRRQGAERIEITWPSGRVDQLTNVSADQIIVIREGEGQISSPYKPLRQRSATSPQALPKKSRP